MDTNSTNTRPFTERLRYAMKDKKVTAYWLSKKTGISQPNLSRYLSGKAEPRRKFIIQIADALNVSVLWLIGISNDYAETAEKKNKQKAVITAVEGLDEGQLDKVITMMEVMLGIKI